jgi:hypothetical protein
VSALWAPIGGDAPRALRDKPRLKAVPRPPARLARIPFIAVLIAVFGVGMAGLLMLNTTLQNQAFEGRALTRQANELIYSQAELDSELSRRTSAAELGRRASALGLRPNPRPAFLVVPSGKIIGKQLRVKGREVPSLIVKTPQQEAAARAAAEAKRRASAVEQAARARAESLAAARRAADQARAAQQRQPLPSVPVAPAIPTTPAVPTTPAAPSSAPNPARPPASPAAPDGNG